MFLPDLIISNQTPVSYHTVYSPASVRVRVPQPFRHVPHNGNIPALG
jgi:hypothetical protein